MRFLVENTAGGNPSWWLIASNGEKVAYAGETFASMSNAKRAAAAFKAGAAEAKFEVYEDKGGKYRWRAFRGGNNVASSGEPFASKSNAQRAADNVQAKAGGAEGP
ncbi:YegP family protein [Leucobacter luti]|uniref:YegP family protein n=1 Tax=Leucobacter luti TaxID=340320 RepID=UPI003D0681DC